MLSASQTHALSMLDACSVHASGMHARVGALAIEGEVETEVESYVLRGIVLLQYHHLLEEGRLR
jgi:hypothetical protein